MKTTQILEDPESDSSLNIIKQTNRKITSDLAMKDILESYYGLSARLRHQIHSPTVRGIPI